MRIYKSVNPFPPRKRFKQIIHKNRMYSFGFRTHPYSSSASACSVICFEIFCFKMEFAEFHESASLLIADNQSLLVASSFGKANTCFLQGGVIPFVINNSFSFFVGLNPHPFVFFLFQNSMMFPVRQPMIIIIKANTFDEFFSRNKL